MLTGRAISLHEVHLFSLAPFILTCHNIAKLKLSIRASVSC